MGHQMKTSHFFLQLCGNATFILSHCQCCGVIVLVYNKSIVEGKARRLKQAKEEAQAEVEQYRQEREKQYKNHEQKVCESKASCRSLNHNW